MKNIFKFLGLAILLFVTSCDKSAEWKQPNIALVPVYSVNAVDNSSFFERINVYKKGDLIIEHISSSKVEKYEATDYSDTSTDTDYLISVTKKIEDSEGMVSESLYVIAATKSTGVGSLTIDGGTPISVVIAEEEVYN